MFDILFDCVENFRRTPEGTARSKSILIVCFIHVVHCPYPNLASGAASSMLNFAACRFLMLCGNLSNSASQFSQDFRFKYSSRTHQIAKFILVAIFEASSASTLDCERPNSKLLHIQYCDRTNFSRDKR